MNASDGRRVHTYLIAHKLMEVLLHALIEHGRRRLNERRTERHHGCG
jgi:hypothetical protein